MKIQLFLLMFIVILFSGCANQQSGNFIKASQPLNYAILVKDTVTELTTILPPAKSTINFVYPKNESFGIALLKELRKKGYAVQEQTPSIQDKVIIISYVLAPINNLPLYLIQININNGAISRPYSINNNNQFEPAGSWSRKE